MEGGAPELHKYKRQRYSREHLPLLCRWVAAALASDQLIWPLDGGRQQAIGDDGLRFWQPLTDLVTRLDQELVPEAFAQAKMYGVHHIRWAAIDGAEVAQPVDNHRPKACRRPVSKLPSLAPNEAVLLLIIIRQAEPFTLLRTVSADCAPLVLKSKSSHFCPSRCVCNDQIESLFDELAFRMSTDSNRLAVEVELLQLVDDELQKVLQPGCRRLFGTRQRRS